MPGIEVLSRTQRIIVLPNTSVSIVKQGPSGPPGPEGALGPPGPPGLDGDITGSELFIPIAGGPTSVDTVLDFLNAPSINGELLEVITMLVEDEVHVTGAPGLLGLAVRRDADTPTVDATGDYSPLLVDALGRLKIKHVKDTQIVNGTMGIANGESISSLGGDANTGIIDLTKKSLVGIQMPAAWTAAGLSFSVSMDGGTTYNDLYDDTMTERSIAVVASRSITLDPTKFMGCTHLKFRSGTGAGPVNQGAARTINYTTVAL